MRQARAPTLSAFEHPEGPSKASKCREAKIAARQFLPLIALTARASLKKEEKPSLAGERNVGGISRDNSGESIREPKIATR